jgi:glutathione S-transferase
MATTSWPALRELAEATPVGAHLAADAQLRAAGGGPPSKETRLRLFGGSEADVRVTLFRDTAAWCPYCQKVWLMLEEKRIPYRTELINMYA